MAFFADSEQLAVQIHYLDGVRIEWHEDYPVVWLMTCPCSHVGVWDRSARPEYWCSRCGKVTGPLD